TCVLKIKRNKRVLRFQWIHWILNWIIAYGNKSTPTISLSILRKYRPATKIIPLIPYNGHSTKALVLNKFDSLVPQRTLPSNSTSRNAHKMVAYVALIFFRGLLSKMALLHTAFYFLVKWKFIAALALHPSSVRKSTTVLLVAMSKLLLTIVGLDLSPNS
ncbi:unnamed protein product, partial [Heterotrigona itama]